jgi:hypothetical protein
MYAHNTLRFLYKKIPITRDFFYALKIGKIFIFHEQKLPLKDALGHEMEAKAKESLGLFFLKID